MNGPSTANIYLKAIIHCITVIFLAIQVIHEVQFVGLLFLASYIFLSLTLVDLRAAGMSQAWLIPFGNAFRGIMHLWTSTRLFKAASSVSALV